MIAWAIWPTPHKISRYCGWKTSTPTFAHHHVSWKRQQAAALDSANSYLPFMGANDLRQAATDLVSRPTGLDYDWNRSTIICAGGLNGILNVLLALLEPGDEVVMTDPIYVGLVNRVRLAGGVPVFVPYQIANGTWSFDRDQVGKAVTSKTRVFLMMSPSMPGGGVFSREDWEAICLACRKAGAWMLVDSAMERILFDRAEHLHPASMPGMAERTITVGTVSKEYRMIGWRVGWIVAPPEIIEDFALVNTRTWCARSGSPQRGRRLRCERPIRTWPPPSRSGSAPAT